MDFYGNYLKLCNMVGKSPSRVASEIGLSRTAVNKWKHGGVPTDATVNRVADYFHVDGSELTGDVSLGTMLMYSNPVMDAADELVSDIEEENRKRRLQNLGEIMMILSTASDDDVDLVLSFAQRISSEK